ncbi:MAG: efflux RND transporter periplasmic adaptor subunit [Flavobacteriaceae bacterium]
MKRAFNILGLILLLAACQSGPDKSVDTLITEGNLEAIKTKKQQISEQQKELNNEIRKLDSAINTMDKDARILLVTTIEVEEQPFKHFLELQGNVKTRQNVLVYPEMSGTLLKIYVKEGQRVSKGQVLAKIDDGGMASRLDQLKTQEALAKTTFERQKRLWEQNIGSEIQYLQAKTNYEATENSVKQTESQLGKSIIRAPFSGIVDDLVQDEGTVVSPATGMAIFRIVNLSDMHIEVDVPESYLEGVTPGKEVRVYFPVLRDSVSTQVRQTGNFINPANRSFRIEIPVPNKEGTIKPNLTARVSINDYSNEHAILIPQSVISENSAGQQYIYTAVDADDENRARAMKQIVVTGKTSNDLVEILEGIDAGDQVIEEGARNVREGQAVRIIK